MAARAGRGKQDAIEHPLATQALAAFVAADSGSTRLVADIRRIAAAESTVLIEGESGTGKDLAASLLHYLGGAPEGPLVKIDCAGIPATLMESELFGYERGAFTGATAQKQGRLELAGKGTIVLDDVNALTPEMQAKLLRVLEDRTFFRLGGTRPVKLPARIIATTNEDLAHAVALRRFRQDLYYRLNVVPIRLKPLRERVADVAPLAQKLLADAAGSQNRTAPKLTRDALTALESYAWPGNVRELRNLMERLLVQLPVAQSISAADLPASIRPVSGKASKPSLEEVEKAYIAEVLDFTRGKKGKAAEILGISRKNLLEKRKRYNL